MQSHVTTGSPNVLVVGAGPVGTTAACLLSDRLGPSASVTILERRSDPTRMDDASRMSARLYPMALNERSFDALARARLEDIQGGHKLRGFAVLTKEGRVKQFNLPGQDEDRRILIDWVTWTSNLITLAGWCPSCRSRACPCRVGGGGSVSGVCCAALLELLSRQASTLSPKRLVRLYDAATHKAKLFMALARDH